jgi:predicted amidohydrolase YtcJ
VIAPRALRRVLPLVPLAACATRPRPAAIVLRNAAVYTMAEPARAQAIAIRGGEIVFVGTDRESDRFVAESTAVVDLGGRTVLPGFHDTHVHPEGGIELGQCALDDLETRQAILDSVARCAKNQPGTPWVRGSGWALPVFPGANPSSAWLDQVVPDRPVFLTAADGHSAWVNGKALALAGVDRNTPDPPNGRIERTPGTGQPSGTLRESAIGLVSRLLPAYTAAEREEGLRRAIMLANRYGITTLHDAATSPDLMEAYAALDRKGELTARVIATQYVDPAQGTSQVDSIVARRDRYRGSEMFRPLGAKLFADGVIEAHTAALLAPYLGPGKPTTGMPNFTPESMDSLVVALDRARIQIHIHAIGDRAIRMGLDAIAKARVANPAWARRPIIAHIQLFDPADIPRFKELGVIASFQPLWAFRDEYISDLTEPVLGPERSRWLYPIGSMVKSGAVVTGGSDWTVSSMNPLEAIQVAVTRRSPFDSAGPAWIPEELVDLDPMLRAYTVNGAYAAGDERTNGTLEVGKAADLIVLDHDLHAIPAARIHTAKVLLTIVGGKEVYRDRVLR